MWFSPFRRFVFGQSTPPRPKRSRSKRRTVPMLEYLEDRIVPSTLTVDAGDVNNPTPPTGDYSLVGAINQANTDSANGINDTISLTNSTYTITSVNNTTNGANALPVITAKGLTIQGNGSTIDGAGLARLFDVASGAGLTLDDLTITGGKEVGSQGTGPGKAGGNAQGGGLYVSGGTVNLTNCNVTNNIASAGNGGAGAAGGAAQGGGIYATGAALKITDGSVSNNNVNGGHGGTGAAGTATHATGGAGGAGGAVQGAGVYAKGGSLTLTSSLTSLAAVNKNTAFAGLGGNGGAGANAGSVFGAGGAGGAGGNGAGGGVYTSNSTLLVEGGATINENTIEEGAGGTGGAAGLGKQGGSGGIGGLAQGGGLYAYGGNVSVTGVGTAISADTAKGGFGGFGGAGGAASVANNFAGGAGGVAGAGGEADGGGLYVLSPLTMNGGAVANGNTDTGGDGGHGGAGGAASGTLLAAGAGGAGGAGGFAQGGGLFANGSNLAVNLGNSTSTATINANSAFGGKAGQGGAGGTGVGGAHGGAGGNGGTGSSATGGGVTVIGDTLTLTNAVIQKNTALGGPIPGNGASGFSGGNAGNGGSAGNTQGGGLFVSGSTVTVLNSTLSGNTANGGSGGGAGNVYGGGQSGVGGNSGSGQGGGLYAAGSTVSAFNSTIANNIAEAAVPSSTPTRPFGTAGSAQGGGLYATNGTLTLTNDTIAWNFLWTTAPGITPTNPGTNLGGGIYNDTSDTLHLENTIVALDQLFTQSSAQTGDLYGNAASSDDDFIGDGSGSNLVNGTNGDQVGTYASPFNPQFLPSTPSNIVVGQGQTVGNYGGLTPTLPLNWNSAALNTGDPSAAAAIATAEGVTTDNATGQRGFPRVIDGTIDIGATETQLSVSVSGAPATVSAGSQITYTLNGITVFNGETTPVAVTLTDVVPTNTTFSSFTPSASTALEGWNVTTPLAGQTGTVTASIASLAPNTTATFTLIVTVGASTPASTVIANTATITLPPSVNTAFSRAATQDTTVSGSSTTNITSKVGIVSSPVLPNPFGGPNAFVQGLLLINNSGATINGPVALVLTGLPAGVTLTNATGTYEGSPYINIVSPTGTWKAGWTHFLLAGLEFSDPSHAKITYTAEILQGI